MSLDHNLYSIQLEMHFLGGLFKHPSLFPEVDLFISEKEFTNRVHSTIFSVVRRVLLNGETLDKIIVAQKIQDLGIKFKDDINIFDYIENLSFTQINPKGVIDAARNLVKLRIRRELYSNADDVKKFIVENPDKDVSDLINNVDSIYNQQITNYKIDQGPQDLFADIDENIDRIAANPVKEVGLLTPYPEFNRLFGGLRSKNGIYCVASRPKSGKSTWLQNMAVGIVAMNPETKVLILDTEMTRDVSQYRVAASLTQVPYWFYESGNWIKNPELREKRKTLTPQIQSLKNKIYHMNVVNKSTQELCSIMRRWYYNKVGRGNKALIILDYIKMANEKLSEANKEYQIIGDKINFLNETGNFLDVPIWSAMQLNRGGEGNKAADDGTALAMSDRISWFGCWVGIFRKKKIEEIQEDGERWGTHKLLHLVSRFQGKDAYGMHDLVRIDDGHGKITYKDNFINYELRDFKIKEIGTLRDIVAQRNLQVNLAQPPPHDDGSISL